MPTTPPTTPDVDPTARIRPARYPDRMRYDRETVHAILDEAFHSHLSFVVDGRPRVLPTMHVRIGDMLFLHGSTGSTPMLAARADGIEVCVATTLIDGLVFARSQPHHSAKYRSVIAHGRARLVTDDATKRAVSAALMDKLAAGRSADSRPPSAKDLGRVAMLALPLVEAAAKVRSGEGNDEEADLALPHWAGLLPLRLVADEPEPERPGMVLPDYLLDWHIGHRPARSHWLDPVPMSGELVRLEPLGPQHVDDLFEATRDPDVWRWQHRLPETRADLARLVGEALRAHSRGERVPWVQIEQATGRPIGSTSFYDIDPQHRRVEIGYTWLGRPWWRTGINTEAKLLLMARAFEDLGALRVSWRTDHRNNRSQAAIERLGATREGVFRRHMIRPDGTHRDSVFYAMTADEWPANRDRLRTRLAAAAPAT